MSTKHTPDEDPLDRRLVAAYSAFVTDVATALDLTAGLADATRPALYADLTDDLTTTLDLNAGLAAILDATVSSSSANNSAAPPSQSPTQTHPSLLSRLAAMSDIDRLGFRNHSALRELVLATNLAAIATQACAFAGDLVLALDLAHRIERDHGFKPLELSNPAGADDFLPNRISAFQRVRTLVRDLDRHLDLARNVADDLDRARNLKKDPDHTGDFDHILTVARAHVRELDSSVRSAHSPRDFSRFLDRDVVRLRDQALDSLRIYVRVLNRALGHDRLEAFENPTTTEGLAKLLALLIAMRDDFVSADLSAADRLVAANLTGVRWSSRTTWPSGWIDSIRAASVEVELGIFEITEWRQRSVAEAAV